MKKNFKLIFIFSVCTLLLSAYITQASFISSVVPGGNNDKTNNEITPKLSQSAHTYSWDDGTENYMEIDNSEQSNRTTTTLYNGDTTANTSITSEMNQNAPADNSTADTIINSTEVSAQRKESSGDIEYASLEYEDKNFEAHIGNDTNSLDTSYEDISIQQKDPLQDNYIYWVNTFAESDYWCDYITYFGYSVHYEDTIEESIFNVDSFFDVSSGLEFKASNYSSQGTFKTNFTLNVIDDGSDHTQIILTYEGEAPILINATGIYSPSLNPWGTGFTIPLSSGDQIEFIYVGGLLIIRYIDEFNNLFYTFNINRIWLSPYWTLSVNFYCYIVPLTFYWYAGIINFYWNWYWLSWGLMTMTYYLWIWSDLIYIFSWEWWHFEVKYFCTTYWIIEWWWWNIEIWWFHTYIHWIYTYQWYWWSWKIQIYCYWYSGFWWFNYYNVWIYYYGPIDYVYYPWTYFYHVPTHYYPNRLDFDIIDQKFTDDMFDIIVELTDEWGNLIPGASISGSWAGAALTANDIHDMGTGRYHLNVSSIYTLGSTTDQWLNITAMKIGYYPGKLETNYGVTPNKLFIDVITELFEEDNFQITIKINDYEGNSVNDATISGTWNGVTIPNGNITNNGDGTYQLILKSILVAPGDPAIDLNIQAVKTSFITSSINHKIAVDPETVDKQQTTPNGGTPLISGPNVFLIAIISIFTCLSVAFLLTKKQRV